MSNAETVALLRRAADKIREEWAEPRGSAWSRVQQYHAAMADWLDGEAATRAEMEPLVDLLNVAIENTSGVTGYLQLGRTEEGEMKFYADTSPAAVRFARAYLGESA